MVFESFSLQRFAELAQLNWSGTVNINTSAQGKGTIYVVKDADNKITYEWSDPAPTGDNLIATITLNEALAADAENFSGANIKTIEFNQAYTQGVKLSEAATGIDVSGTGVGTTPITINNGATFTAGTSCSLAEGKLSKVEGTLTVTAGALTSTVATAATVKAADTSIVYDKAVELSNIVVTLTTGTVKLTDSDKEGNDGRNGYCGGGSYWHRHRNGGIRWCGKRKRTEFQWSNIQTGQR